MKAHRDQYTMTLIFDLKYEGSAIKSSGSQDIERKPILHKRTL